jgi:hypothetical protein
MVSSYAGIGVMGNQSQSDRAREAGWAKVQSEFGSLPYNCEKLDIDLKRLEQAIINAYKIPLKFDERGNADLYQRAYKEELEGKKKYWENLFTKNNCRDVFENIRLKSAGLTETKFAIQSEKQVLGESNKNQNLYIGVGAIVMLVGLYVILKK